MTKRKCSMCKHCSSGEMGQLVCLWEKSFLPRPVSRARLWGKEAPSTYEEWAKDCQHFEVEDTTGEDVT